MKELTKSNLAELVIYSDLMHDILSQYDFNRELKFEFNKVDKSVKKIIRMAFGNEDVGQLDSWKHKIRIKTNELIKDEIFLND